MLKQDPEHPDVSMEHRTVGRRHRSARRRLPDRARGRRAPRHRRLGSRRIHCLVGLWTAVLAQFIEINRGNHEPTGFKLPTQELLRLGLDSTQKP